MLINFSTEQDFDMVLFGSISQTKFGILLTVSILCAFGNGRVNRWALYQNKGKSIGGKVYITWVMYYG